MNIKIQGGQKLSGKIRLSGSKNSAMSTLAASLLFKGEVVLQHIPDITDVQRMLNIFEKLGAKVEWNKESEDLKMDMTNLSFEELDKDDVGRMKGMALLWGAMLGRFNKVTFGTMPGGCTLGNRPVDAHLKAFVDMGVKITENGEGLHMDASHAEAREVWLWEMSPTATANAVMLAATLEGETVITGAASEPSVQDMCLMLKKAGVKIEGIGSNVIKVLGTDSLQNIEYRIFSDHLEMATFLALGACTGGRVEVEDGLLDGFTQIVRNFEQFNVKLDVTKESVVVPENVQISLNGGPGHTTLVRCQPWPGLPVDSLPLFIPLALAAPEGQVMFHNWMYESALYWTSELTKFGGSVVMCDPHRIIVNAGNALQGAKIESPYIIRAAVALVMTALMAKGESEILNAEALYRGHPKFAENLRSLGAVIEV